jgi:hypothetical protein
MCLHTPDIHDQPACLPVILKYVTRSGNLIIVDLNVARGAASTYCELPEFLGLHGIIKLIVLPTKLINWSISSPMTRLNFDKSGEITAQNTEEYSYHRSSGDSHFAIKLLDTRT